MPYVMTSRGEKAHIVSDSQYEKVRTSGPGFGTTLSLVCRENPIGGCVPIPDYLEHKIEKCKRCKMVYEEIERWNMALTMIEEGRADPSDWEYADEEMDPYGAVERRR